ncbi:MAG: hypothetical protein ABR543_02505 [Gemmatimonadaceae bacterium]
MVSSSSRQLSAAAWFAASFFFLSCAQDEARAQAWNDPRTMMLVQRATERRALQIADTALSDYRARAHGYVTFLAQVGEGFTEPPRIVKADELALEVYWQAPARSKQLIVGQRDTLLLPTDIAYHRDHLGIVQGNFPNIIRLGDGDEVEDVPHPFSGPGLESYDFAIRDSLQITLPDRTLDVYEVRIRPRDDELPRVIGAAYVDRTSADVVRLAFNFTRAAFKDRQLEDLAVVLENALIESRFWLPHKQEIEIRRTGTWLDYPARGIIRGRWEICCYEVNQGIDPSLFSGPEIDSVPASVLARHEWDARILDSLPTDVRAVTDEDVRRVQEEARELVREQALARTSGATISARRVSDFVRVNRAEGLAAGAALTTRLGRGRSITLGGRWGTKDREAKGRAVFEVRRANGAGLRVFAVRDYRDASDVQETSLLRNSLAAQEFGSDYTQPFDVRGGGVGVLLKTRARIRWEIEAAYEIQDRVTVSHTPSHGRFEPTIPAWSLEVKRMAIRAERPTSLSFLGTELYWTVEARAALVDGHDTTLASGTHSLGRIFTEGRLERPIGDQRLVLRTAVGAVSAKKGGGVPPQDLVFLGGPTSAPGYRFHEFAASIGASQHLELQTPVSFLSIPLGRYGRAPGTATLAPFAHIVYVSKVSPLSRAQGAGWYPSAGVGMQFFFDLIRMDVARGLRDGRWTFSLDVARDFWRAL